MAETLVSTKYQVVIPKVVRKKIRVKPGQRLDVSTSGDKIILSPKRKWPDYYFKALKDDWKGVDIDKYLEEERNSWGEE